MKKPNQKKIFLFFLLPLIFLLSFSSIFWDWIIWDWIKNPDAKTEERFWEATIIYWVEAIQDNFLWWKYWQFIPSWTAKWAECTYNSKDDKDCKNYPEPTWNWKWYTYPEWRTEDYYPAFKHCSSLWDWWWRLPTIEELYSLMTYTTKNTTTNWWAFSNHPNINNTWYWTSTASASNTKNASYVFYVNFSNACTSATSKYSNHSVLCTHD